MEAKIEMGLLTLNKVANSIGDTLYAVLDFPVEDNPDVVRSLRAYWSEHKGVRKVVFLPSHDKPVLEKELKGKNFYIYGTFAPREDNLLFRALPDAPFFDDLKKEVTAYEGVNVCLIIVGRNPFGGGFVNIFAAGSPNLLPDIHEFYDGTKSLIAVVEGTVFNKMVFDSNFSFKSTFMSLSEALEDVNFFFRTLESVHPQLLAFVSPEDYLKLKQEVRERIREAAGVEGKLSLSSLAVILAEAAAFFKDGHTFLNLNPSLVDEADTTRRMLPFRLRYYLGRILIGNTVRGLENLKGCKLLKMNDVDFIEFIRPILAKISGEREAHRIAEFMYAQRTYWALIPPTDSSEVSITVQDKEGNIRSLEIELISIREYDKIPKGEEVSLRSFHRFYHGGKTCYFQYNSFIYSDKEKRYIDSLFKLLHERKTQNLIIDLRFNIGGDSRMGDYILDHLTSKPYRMFSRMDVKLSKEVFEQGLYDNKFEELTGLTVTCRNSLKQPKDRGYRFKGRLFLLTGPYTFSSAAAFAAVVKDFKMGTIIGEETGSPRQCFGDALRFSLPHSGLMFNVSYKHFYAPMPKPDDDIHGTIPDIVVDEEMLSEYKDAEDPLLAFVLDYILDDQ